MTKFVVDLGKLHIPDEKKAEISASIQQVVLSHLATIEGPPSENLFGLSSFGIRQPWWGYILRERMEELFEAANTAASHSSSVEGIESVNVQAK